jgi:Zn-dependent peptidase ImmA (M78 family)
MQLKKDQGVKYVKGDLGYENCSKVLGLTDFRNKSIAIDISFESDECNKLIRVPFVIAHEIGHWIVHGPRYSELKMAGVFEQSTSDTIDMITGKKVFETDRDFIEHQANVFAANILVPVQTFRKALINAQERVGINRKRGIVYLDRKKSYSYWDFQRTLMELKRFYYVSKEVLKIRLYQTSLIEGPIDKKTQSIAAVLIGMGFNQSSVNWIED